MLSLTENIFRFTKSKSLWSNKLLLFSLAIHFICIGLAFCLLIIHKFWWEPSYNTSEKAMELSPIDDMEAWDNPYCDEYFLKYNLPLPETSKVVPFKPKPKS